MVATAIVVKLDWLEYRLEDKISPEDGFKHYMYSNQPSPDLY
jgi:hypothetical protein